NSTSPLRADGIGCPPSSASIADFLGYGSGANCFEGSNHAPSPNATNADFRAQDGCRDTDDNGSDFTASVASPRNSSSPFHYCQATATPTDTPTLILTPTETPTGTTT